jgi:hypothetical protein
MMVSSQNTTWPHDLKDLDLKFHHCENLNCCNVQLPGLCNFLLHSPVHKLLAITNAVCLYMSSCFIGLLLIVEFLSLKSH